MLNFPTHQSDRTRRSEIVVNHLALLNEYDFTEPHRHDYYEFFYFERGGGTHRIDFMEFPVKTNSVHIVAPGQVHQMHRALDSEGYVCLFEMAALDAPKPIEDFLFSHSCLSAEELSPIYELPEERLEEFKRKMRKIYDHYQSGTDIDKLSINNEIQSFCIACIAAGNEMPADNSEYMRFRSLLKEKFMELKKVKEYAARMNVSEKTLNEMVKKHSGQPASTIIYRHIIIEAKRLLNTSMSVKETAYALNFDDPAHFSKFFKAQTGLSPSDFQNNT